MPKVREPMATYCKCFKKTFELSLIYQVFLLFVSSIKTLHVAFPMYIHSDTRQTGQKRTHLE